MPPKRLSSLSVILITIIVIVCCLIVWHANTVFLLAFAGVLLAIFLHFVSSLISQKSHFPYSLVLSSVLIGILAILVVFFWSATPLISAQLVELFEQVPKGFEQFKEHTKKFINWNSFAAEGLANKFILNEKFFTQAKGVISFTAVTITGFVFFLFIGIYLAYDPNRYIRGFIHFIPPKKRKRAELILAHLAHALRWWLVGKCISMTAIGILTMLGLWVLHVPLAFILGLLAGLLAFIPYVGSIIASVPAILIALSQYPLKAVYVIILFCGIHALEGYCITPIIEQRTVSLPPALTVMAQVVLVMIVGFLGLALASPLTLVFIILLREFAVSHRGLSTKTSD